MLRESSKVEGTIIQLKDVTGGLSANTKVEGGELLVDLAEAIVVREKNRIKKCRQKVYDLLGNSALVDAVAVASAFHGFVRIADSIGIPYNTAARGQDAADIRDEVGINEFHRIKELG